MLALSILKQEIEALQLAELFEISKYIQGHLRVNFYQMFVHFIIDCTYVNYKNMSLDIGHGHITMIKKKKSSVLLVAKKKGACYHLPSVVMQTLFVSKQICPAFFGR